MGCLFFIFSLSKFLSGTLGCIDGILSAQRYHLDCTIENIDASAYIVKPKSENKVNKICGAMEESSIAKINAKL